MGEFSRRLKYGNSEAEQNHLQQSAGVRVCVCVCVCEVGGGCCRRQSRVRFQFLVEPPLETDGRGTEPALTSPGERHRSSSSALTGRLK